MQTSQNQQLSKKQQVLERLFLQCEQKKSYEFSNSDVKQVAAAVGFGNPFDATKVDSREVLPAVNTPTGVLHCTHRQR
jgi:hypothetical protein